MKVLELFSGIGGFSLGLQRAGFNIQKHWFSEIDKHCVANYKYNFSNAEYIGSVADVRGCDIERADIMTFGFPCQDLSLAGKRLGFKGKRSSLFYQAARVLRENQSNVFIWENVAGLMSSNNGDDIKAVFEELYLSGYIFDVNLINTAWFLPQNRLRLYSIGYNIKYLQQCLLSSQSGQKANWNLFVKILEGKLLMKYPSFLTEAQNLSELRQKELALRYLKTKEENLYSGENLKLKYLDQISILQLKILENLYHTAQSLLSKQCVINSNLWTKQNQVDVQEAIKLDMEKNWKQEEEKYISSIGILLKNLSDENFQELNRYTILTLINETTTLRTFTYAEMQLNTELFIIQLNLLYPNCWNEALLNLIEKAKNIFYVKNRTSKGGFAQEDANNAIQLSFADGFGTNSIGHLAGRSEPRVFPIGETNPMGNESRKNSKKVHSNNRNALTQQARQFASWNGDFVKQLNPSIESGGTMPYQQNRVYDAEGISPALLSGMSCGTHAVQVNPVQLGQSNRTFAAQYGTQIGEGDAFTIRASQPNGVKIESNIRRLTEIECERLQGFPDFWTKYGNYDGVIKEIPKTQRYKMCGNAVTVDVLECIGRKLLVNLQND